IDQLLRPILKQDVYRSKWRLLFPPRRAPGSGRRPMRIACVILLLHLHKLGRGWIGLVEDLPLAVFYFVDRNVDHTGHSILVKMEVSDQGMEFLGVELLEDLFSGHATTFGGRLDGLYKDLTGGICNRPEFSMRVVDLGRSVGLLKPQPPTIRVLVHRQPPKARERAFRGVAGDLNVSVGKRAARRHQRHVQSEPYQLLS